MSKLALLFVVAGALVLHAAPLDRKGVEFAHPGGKALLLDLPRRDNPTRFEVITPQAIAAVRGTQWAVDVQGGKTSVFVVKGHVEVRRPSSTAAVNLGAGQGVDVEAGGAPLVVKNWPAKRVAALMARLGR